MRSRLPPLLISERKGQQPPARGKGAQRRPNGSQWDARPRCQSRGANCMVDHAEGSTNRAGARESEMKRRKPKENGKNGGQIR